MLRRINQTQQNQIMIMGRLDASWQHGGVEPHSDPRMADLWEWRISVPLVGGCDNRKFQESGGTKMK